MSSTEDTVSVALSGSVTLIGVDGTAVTGTYPVTITATASGTGTTATTSTVASASGGSYKMSVPPGQITVTFQNSQLSEVSEIILAAFSTPNVLDVTMTVSATLTGIVTDYSTGNPLSDVSVSIFNNSTNKKWSATTNSSGAYSIQSVPVGTYDVEVEGEEGATDVNDLSLPAGDSVKNFKMGGAAGKIKVTGTVVQGEETETGMEGGTIVLQPAMNISGATVTATNMNSGALLDSTTSDSNGNFSLEFSDASFVLTAKKNGVEYATENVNEEAIGGGVIISAG